MDELDEIFGLLRSDQLLTRLNGRQRLASVEHPEKLVRLGRLAADASAPPGARADALGLLERLGPTAKDAVLPLLGDADPVVRAAAVEALAGLDAAAFSAWAVALLGDSSARVRLAVLTRAYRAKDRDPLIRRGLTDPVPQLRAVAARQLGPHRSGWPAALAAALEASKGDAYVEADILFALVCCKGEPDLAAATARIAPRAIELAGDEYAYDLDDHLEAGRWAAELLALTGVPPELIPALDAALARPGLTNHVREHLRQARQTRRPA